MYVSFVRVTAEELEKATLDEAWGERFLAEFYDWDTRPPAKNSEVDIQKSWAALDHLLDKAMVPLSIQEDGYCLVNGDGWYRNGWTVDEVARAAQTFTRTPFETLAAHYDAEAMSREEVYPNRRCWDQDDLRYLERDFDSLRDFFLAAAASGHAVIMSFG